MVTAPDLSVTGSHRDKAGQVEIHDKETGVIYMIEGEATFVTGGAAGGGYGRGFRAGPPLRAGQEAYPTLRRSRW